MSNVLDHEKQQQILALGRLGWPLRRIEAATGIRRETVVDGPASGYRYHLQRARSTGAANWYGVPRRSCTLGDTRNPWESKGGLICGST
jgi:hypothetical protein